MTGFWAHLVWSPEKNSRVTVKKPSNSKNCGGRFWPVFIKPPNTWEFTNTKGILLGTICAGLFPNMFFWDKSVTLKIWERKTSIFQVQIWFWFHGNLDWRHQMTIWSTRNSEENCQICMFLIMDLRVLLRGFLWRNVIIFALIKSLNCSPRNVQQKPSGEITVISIIPV